MHSVEHAFKRDWRLSLDGGALLEGWGGGGGVEGVKRVEIGSGATHGKKFFAVHNAIQACLFCGNRCRGVSQGIT